MKLTKKAILWALAAALVWVSLPFTSVFAAGQEDTSTPPQNQISNEHLERAWARQLRIYDRFGKTDEFIDRTQKLIDRAKAQGIPPEALPHLFDRFYQVDPSRAGGEGHGAGLGLAIVKEIVEAHGGRISVRSELGHGTTLVIQLPLAKTDRLFSYDAPVHKLRFP